MEREGRKKERKKKINFQDRGNSMAFIAILPSHDLENGEFLKSGGFAFKKQTVFTPLRPSLAFNPLLLLGFFYPESLLLRHFFSFSLFFPFFFSLLPFFFIESKTNPWNFRRNPSEYAGYASSASPLWFHPSAARWSPEIRKKFTCFYPRHFAITRLSLSLSLCFVRFKASRLREKEQRRISPRTNVFSHSFYAFTWWGKGGALDNGVTGIVSTISNQTLDS